uniref:Ig-like domain-containing protein n=1 Tax=Timema monikensis TaxID=170555 RepID=A0A7R9EH58_9NEOP|nr:unnamed protein product [Timema monikensis]
MSTSMWESNLIPLALCANTIPLSNPDSYRGPGYETNQDDSLVEHFRAQSKDPSSIPMFSVEEDGAVANARIAGQDEGFLDESATAEEFHDKIKENCWVVNPYSAVSEKPACLTSHHTPDRDSKIDIPIIGSPVYCENSTFDYVATEVGICALDQATIHCHKYHWIWVSLDLQYTYEQGILLFLAVNWNQIGEELHSSSTSPPRDMIVEKGSEVLLSCKSSIRVEECQWSWKDLFDDDKVDVKSFHSFGDDHHDCSVRFNNILSDQQGVWSCAVRSKNDTNFVIITEVRLAVLPSHLVQFMEEPSDTEVIVGNTCTLTCKTMDPTSNCQWTWRPSGTPQEKDIVIQEIFPNGLSNDCSLHLDNVSEEQDGLWTCGARAKPYQNYTITHTVKLTVVNAPLEFIELPGNSKVTVDTSKTLKCILSTSVEERQWKSEDTNNSNLVLVEQFTPMDKLKRDCSITIDKIKIEQEGYWICGARRRGDVKFIDSLLSHLTIYTGSLIDWRLGRENRCSRQITSHGMAVEGVDPKNWYRRMRKA